MDFNANCIADCKKFLGLPPYNTDTNVLKGDPFVLELLYKEYGVTAVRMTIIDLKRGKK